MDYIRLSRILAYILRHHPEDFGITLDKDGFALTSDLVVAINTAKKFDNDITQDDLVYVNEHDEKQRFEIIGDKMRALYGHSNGIETIKEPTEPPEFLYHGTSIQAAEEIRKHGLKSMSRQFVHLSADIETAIAVGKRRDDNPVVIKILAKKAYKCGIKFYRATNNIWLCNDLKSNSYLEQTEYVIFTERTKEDIIKIRCLGPNQVIYENLEVYNGKTLLSQNALCVYPTFGANRESFFEKLYRYAKLYKYKNYIRVKLFPNDKNGEFLHIDLIDVENKTATTLPLIRYCDKVTDIQDGFLNINTEHSRYVGNILLVGLMIFRANHPELDEIYNQ